MLKFWKRGEPTPDPAPAPPAETPGPVTSPPATEAPAPIAPPPSTAPQPTVEAASAPKRSWLDRLNLAPSGPPDPETAAPGAAPVVEATVEPPATPKRSWIDRLKAGLAKTGNGITTLFVGARVDEALFEELEAALLMADAGVEATAHLIAQLRAVARKEAIEDAAQLRVALARLLTDLLRPLEKPFDVARRPAAAGGPAVVMMVGVNGAGKTTSIGKLAKYLQGAGRTVMLAAGDTFRAAAREQLMAWGERNGVTVVAQQSGDPAAVVFDAVASAAARGTDVLIADTAGRLQTQLHLMDELRKVKRVIGKAPALAGTSEPREVLLVIDGNTGQNAIAQVRAFDAAVGLTGLIVTKLDGTAKGGVLAAIAWLRRGDAPLPVYFIGIGEGLDDLQPFVASQFVDALLGEPASIARAD